MDKPLSIAFRRNTKSILWAALPKLTNNATRTRFLSHAVAAKFHQRTIPWKTASAKILLRDLVHCCLMPGLWLDYSSHWFYRLRVSVTSISMQLMFSVCNLMLLDKVKMINRYSLYHSRIVDFKRWSWRWLGYRRAKTCWNGLCYVLICADGVALRDRQTLAGQLNRVWPILCMQK